MKHIFVVNPVAGKKDITTELIQTLENKLKKDYSIYVTSCPNDAKEYVQNVCRNLTEDTVFYACGGDGTLNEVVNGTIGSKHAYVTCFPTGSGNDFIKVFGKKEDFLDLDALFAGEVVLVDTIKVNDRYTLNICNLGFDAFVADNFQKFKNKPLISGKTAYSLSVLYSLLFNMKTDCKISVDDKVISNDKILLSSFANGICYGGGFYCSPKAKIDDSLIDICVVTTMSRFKFLKMVKKYKAGKHLDDPKIMRYITYLRGKKVEVKAKKDIIYCIDGEVLHDKKIDISIYSQNIKFIIPKKS